MILVIQHAPHEGPGLVGELADGRCLPLQTVRTHAGEEVPLPEESSSFTAVFSMGGPMSANDPLPWIAAEKAFLAAAMRGGSRCWGCAWEPN